MGSYRSLRRSDAALTDFTTSTFAGSPASRSSSARARGMGAEDLDVLTRAADLHDIGKIAIPDGVLHKPGPLDAGEWELVHSHTLIGERILETAAALAPVARVVRSSHERWDGGGYPDGLAGEEIPLASRIILICDAYDAMTSDRPYRAAMSTGSIGTGGINAGDVGMTRIPPQEARAEQVLGTTLNLQTAPLQ
jgi:hypothetical protein